MMSRDNKIPGYMESFKERLNEIWKYTDEDKYRRRVLMLCQQTEPKSFDEYSSSGSFRRLEKFESSTYSEVLKAVNLADNNRPVVMKIMRALTKAVIKQLPSAATKGCQSYTDILQELMITKALSQLHKGTTYARSLYRAPFFCFIHEIKVVSGNLERALRKSKISGGPLPSTSRAEADGKIDENKEGEADRQKEEAANLDTKDEELATMSEDDRMLMAALPFEYVVSVMRHDGHPLWWMMTHKKLSADQLSSVLVQVIVGLAIAEKVYFYEHRDLHVSNILIKKTSKRAIPFVHDGTGYRIVSHGVKATIIDATFSRIRFNGKVYYRDLTSTLRSYGSKKTPTRMSLQNRSYRQMVHLTSNRWGDFTPRTNLVWLTYLCETLMKNEIMKGESWLVNEIRKIRDHTLNSKTTMELLSRFPHERKQQSTNHTSGPPGSSS